MLPFIRSGIKIFYRMKISSCFWRLKGLAILVNLVLLLFGIVVLSIGICHKYLCFDTHWYLEIIEESKEYFNITLLRVSSAMVGVGVQMILLGTIGCYGTWHNSLCILGVSLIFLAILLVQDITVIMWPPAYKNAIRVAVENVVAKKYRVDNDSLITEHFDSIQRHLNCCGSEGPSDWFNMTHDNKDDLNIESLNISLEGARNNVNGGLGIPLSCCKNSSSQICYDYMDNALHEQLYVNQSIIHTQVIPSLLS